MLYFFLHVHAGYIRATTTALAVPMSGKKRTKKGKTVTATSQLKKLSTWPDSSKRKIKLSYETATKDDKELLEKIFEWNEFDVQSEDLLSLNGDVSVYGWQHVVNFALFEKYNFLLPLLKEYLTSSARKGGLEDSFDSLRDDQHGLKDFVYVYCTMLTLILRKQEPEEQAIGLIMDALEEVFGPSLEGRLEADDDVTDAFDNYIKTLPVPPPAVVPPPVPPAPARRPSGRSPRGRFSQVRTLRRSARFVQSPATLGWELGSLPLIFKEPYFTGSAQPFPFRSRPLRATVVRNDGRGLCGYLAFGQWLQKYRSMDEAETQCDALRRRVADFDLENNPCGITKDSIPHIDAKTRAGADNAEAGVNWMQDTELSMLACHFEICVFVYKDYPSDNVEYQQINPLQLEFCDEDNTMWLWNNETTLRGTQHYELLIDVVWDRS